MNHSGAGRLRVLALLLGFVLLASCGLAEEGASIGGGGAPEFSDPSYERQPPPVQMPSAPGTNAVSEDDGSNRATVDMSNVSEGYVAVSCESPAQTMFRVQCGDYVYNYALANDGRTEFYPLAVGNGTYSFTVFVQNVGTEYFYFLETSAEVQMADDKVAFLVPNKIVEYTPESEAVAFSYSLAEHASNDLEVIQQVYYWIEQNISYDTDKAGYVQTNTDYLPNVDQVLRDKKGICYDYAALAAAMLRANGIPCKLIMGDANTPEGTVVHAWNMVWTEEAGWIAVKVEAHAGAWERVDLTFASSQNTDIEEFIGDGSNYMEMYIH